MSARGIALVVTLIALAVFSALGLGLVLTTTAERLTSSNFGDATDALNAAEGALELATSELNATADWDSVLSGIRQSSFVDGSPGIRTVGDRTVDLPTLTNQVTCGRDTLCSDSSVHSNGGDRRWGVNNPRWQLFLYGRFSQWVNCLRTSSETYVVVWVGDDAREVDGDVGSDGDGPNGEGRDVVRVRADAFGPGGTRRSVEADVSRLCVIAGGVRTCEPGIHVQSWRVRNGVVP